MNIEVSHLPRRDDLQSGSGASGRTDLTVSRSYSRMPDLPVHSTVRVHADAKHADRWVIVLGALRRQWILLLVAGLLCGVLAGIVAWKLFRPVYRSVGLVRIAYTLPPVLQETDQNQPMQMFDQFMQSQNLLITSRRVTDMAIDDPVWKTTGRELPADPTQYFAQNLKVTITRGSEFIEISVTDPDPGTAAAAVNSVINAYVEQYNSQSKQLERERLGVLDEAQKNLQTEVDKLDAQINEGIAKYGTSDLHSFYDEAVERVNKVKAAIDDTRAEMAVAPSDQVAVDPMADSSSQAPVSLSDEQIAASDPTMRTYLDTRNRWADELKRLKFLGYGDEHAQVISAKWNLNQAEAHLNEYGDHVRVFASATGASFTSKQVVGATTQKSVQELRGNLTNLNKLYEQEKAEMVVWGTDLKKYEDLNQQASADHDKLLALSRRMDVLRTEDSLGGRLSINSTGEIPLSPERDRRILFAAASGAGGTLFPAGLIAMGALVGRRKYLYSEETETRVNPKAPLLGIVPALNGGGPEAAVDASHAVHQIRVTLRSQTPHDGVCVYLVTSALPGEGKTSLTVSLGLSLAAARLRTLVIDGDLVGAQVTRSLKAQGAPGLRDALVEHNLKNLARQAGPNLFILPVGKKTIAANALPTTEIRDLLDQAKEEFDVVLVDTGPVLSSIEAAVLAQEVDGVIFVIGRGQQQSVVERAVRRLDSLGARLEGFVFNRAQPNDFLRSSYGSSSHRSSIGGEPAKIVAAPVPDAGPLKDFGPLVQAMVMEFGKDA
jgi:polysaccharide biosynthesis transport protein